jgi:hypothetical protein
MRRPSSPRRGNKKGDRGRPPEKKFLQLASSPFGEENGFPDAMPACA